MEKSIVYMNKEKNYAIIEKNKDDITKRVVVMFKNKECAILDYDELIKEDYKFNYLLLKHYQNETYAYKDFLKITGKMCKKDFESKYFSKHKEEDNRMIADDLENEHMIKQDEKDKFKDRYEEFKKYVEEESKNIKI